MKKIKLSNLLSRTLLVSLSLGAYSSSTFGQNTCVREENRSIDGTCNNLNKPEYGATHVELVRVLPSEYGSSDPFNALGGENRPTPRLASNVISDQDIDIPSSRNVSAMTFGWGQFIDHDIDLSGEDEEEQEPIFLPVNEPLFISPIPFSRSEHVGGSTSPREQENLLTAWIDASQVYGVDQQRADYLRTFVDGKLKTSSGNLLPYNTIDSEFNSLIDPLAPAMGGDNGGTTKVFVAGDVRANEQNGLTVFHTLFVREHNRLCDELTASGMSNDEEIYQLARKKVSGFIANITFTEFIETGLGVRLNPYNGYQSSVNPNILNVFSTVAFRIGHTMLPNEFLLLNDDCSDFGPGSITLLNAFFSPQNVALFGIEPYLKGFASKTQQEIDRHVVDGVRNFLFGPSFGLDLASLNTQRGRDHGLSDYNSYREYFLGSPATSLADINPDPIVQQDIQTVYSDINDMDPWIVMIAEKKTDDGGQFGPTMKAIIKDQFERLRDGDFYYFENDPYLSTEDRNEIRNTRFADIVSRNTNNTFNQDIFHNNGCPVGSSTARQSTSTESSLNAIVYPNPSTGAFTVDVTGQETVNIEVLTLNGIKIQEVSTEATSGLSRATIDLSEQNSGIYVVKINSDNGSFTERIIVE